MKKEKKENWKRNWNRSPFSPSTHNSPLILTRPLTLSVLSDNNYTLLSPLGRGLWLGTHKRERKILPHITLNSLEKRKKKLFNSTTIAPSFFFSHHPHRTSSTILRRVTQLHSRYNHRQTTINHITTEISFSHVHQHIIGEHTDRRYQTRSRSNPSPAKPFFHLHHTPLTTSAMVCVSRKSSP